MLSQRKLSRRVHHIYKEKDKDDSGPSGHFLWPDCCMGPRVLTVCLFNLWKGSHVSSQGITLSGFFFLDSLFSILEAPTHQDLDTPSSRSLQNEKVNQGLPSRPPESMRGSVPGRGGRRAERRIPPALPMVNSLVSWARYSLIILSPCPLGPGCRLESTLQEYCPRQGSDLWSQVPTLRVPTREDYA